MSELGDCYEAGGKFMMANCLGKPCNYILVHGEVTGQGSIEGVKYGHCWIEDGDMVIDKSNGRNITMPRQVYYMLGGIGVPDMSKWGKEPDAMDTSSANLHKYKWEEVQQKILEFEHWGPWDLVTETGL